MLKTNLLRRLRAACILLVVLAPHAGAQPRPESYAGPDPVLERAAARRFDAIRNDPVALEMRLRAMPKGGDLHNHLTGAIFAESYLRWAAEDGLCIDAVLLRIEPARDGVCAAGQLPAAQAVGDSNLHGRLVDAFSMRNFVPGAPVRTGQGRSAGMAAGDTSGHDHFFGTFEKVRPARNKRGGDMLAEVANRAADEGVSYVELMISPGMGQAVALADTTAEPFERQWERLVPAVAPIIAQALATVDADEARMREIMGCAGAAPQPGCRVILRYVSEVNRGRAVNEIFSQGVLAYQLGKSDSRFVGFNLVGPEDAPRVLASYRDQMTILAWLHAKTPDYPLSLHAGELTQGLVPPEDLLFHIREAVQVAGARRIGHGVDLAFERNPSGLLQLMARKQVAVEINLSSNDFILGVRGKEHPLGQYLKAGVPVVFSTDDPGISRITLTHEFAKAVREQGIDYLSLKTAARNSLEFAFVEGASLWTRRDDLQRGLVDECRELDSASCARYTAASVKARLQAELERDLIAFERGMP